MANVVTMGEIMMRLSPPGNQRFIQADEMEIHYGGAEANVAAVLAGWGNQVSYVTKLPEHGLGDCVIASLRRNGIHTDKIARGGSRLGLYFLENGASVRPTSVIYDRADSSMAQASLEDFDFQSIFQGAELFHVSGITASISPQCGEITLAAIRAAKQQGLKISFDINYRAKLWQTGIEDKQRIFAEILPLVDICFGNPLDAEKTANYHGRKGSNLSYEDYISSEAMAEMAEYYGMQYVVTSRRENLGASDNRYAALVWDGKELTGSRVYSVHIVDRVGTGDSLAAGFLHGVLSGQDAKDALEFGVAAAALKHTMPGDVLYASEAEVLALLQDSRGRVVR
ncbi:MAG: sugar kinase [Clostridiales bacterium]|nr:sugar kinase [Clostridiales bacterium]